VPYVRVSISSPREGSRERMLQIEDALLAYFKEQPGFLEAYRLTSAARVGRVTIWESEASADQAATTEHTLSLRSQLLPLVAESQELAFDGVKIAK
jgi:heme-degrading monooxygenase HmoA